MKNKPSSRILKIYDKYTEKIKKAKTLDEKQLLNSKGSTEIIAEIATILDELFIIIDNYYGNIHEAKLNNLK